MKQPILRSFSFGVFATVASLTGVAHAQTAVAVPVAPAGAYPGTLNAAPPAITVAQPPAIPVAQPPGSPQPRLGLSPNDPDGDGIPGVSFLAQGVPATVRVTIPMPAPQAETVPPPRRMGQVWVPGFYQWSGAQYTWTPGRWVRPPNAQSTWNPPQVTRAGRQWSYRPGFWGQPSSMPANWNARWQSQPVAQQPVAYQLNTVVSGALENSDLRTDLGRLADEYAVNLTARQPVTFVVSGGSRFNGGGLDAFLTIVKDGRIVAQDDNSAGGTNARIVFVPPATGVYVLRVTTPMTGMGRDQGSYTLQSQTGRFASMGGIQLGADFGMPLPQQPPPPPQTVPGRPGGVFPSQPLAVGQAVSGTFTRGDFTVPNGGYADHYQINLQAGQPVTFAAQSVPLSPRATPIDVMIDVLLDGQVVGHDDDSGHGSSARLIFTPPRTGTYQVRVTTWGSNLYEGAYSMQAFAGALPEQRRR